MRPKDVLMTTEEVAQRLRISNQTVRMMIRNGTLRATKIGKQYRIQAGDVEALINKDRSANGWIIEDITEAVAEK